MGLNFKSFFGYQMQKQTLTIFEHHSFISRELGPGVSYKK